MSRILVIVPAPEPVFVFVMVTVYVRFEVGFSVQSFTHVCNAFSQYPTLDFQAKL